MLTVCLILLPILFQFKSPVGVISLGEFLLIPFMVLSLVRIIKKYNGKIKVPSGLGIFYFIPVLLLVVPLLSGSEYFVFGNSLTVIARIIFYFILIVIASYEFDYDKGTKLYLCIGVGISAYLVLQVFGYYVLNVKFPIPLNNPSILFMQREAITVDKYYHMYGFRPASIFVEPSLYADYFAPLIAILLFDNRKDSFINRIGTGKRILIALFFSVTILLTTSNLGLIYCVLLWMGFFLLSGESKIIGTKAKLFIFGIVLVLIGYVLTSDKFSYLFSRFLTGGSLGPRIIRGFIIYSKLPLLNQLFGIGLNNIDPYVRTYGIYTIYDEADLGFSVTLTNRLITTGLIGLVALVIFVIIQFRHYRTTLSKVLLGLMTVSFLLEAGEYTSGFPFLFILAMMSGNYSKGKVSEQVYNRQNRVVKNHNYQDCFSVDDYIYSRK